MIAWPPGQHHDGPASAVGFIENREISQVTFHVLISPFICKVFVLGKQQYSTIGIHPEMERPAMLNRPIPSTAGATISVSPARTAYGAFQRSISLRRIT